jgi:hypothetical protein
MTRLCSLTGIDMILSDLGARTHSAVSCPVNLLSLLLHTGFYSTHNYVRQRKARGLQRALAQLCLELKDVAGPLVDAFDIPDMVLGPMARRDGMSEMRGMEWC